MSIFKRENPPEQNIINQRKLMRYQMLMDSLNRFDDLSKSNFMNCLVNPSDMKKIYDETVNIVLTMYK